MLPGPEIVRPSLAQDRPGNVRLVSIGVLALACGLFLSRASAGRNHLLSESTTEDIGAQVAVATAPEAVEPEPSQPPSAPIEAAPVEPQAPAIASAPLGAALGSAANALTARAVTPTEQHPARSRVTVIPGRVAYLRCDGAAVQDALFPCPRDRALEERVFAAITALGACRDLGAIDPTPRGQVDAWLIFNGPELGGIRLRQSPGGATAEEAIRSCLESRLTSVRSRVDSDRMTVSFRFDLR